MLKVSLALAAASMASVTAMQEVSYGRAMIQADQLEMGAAPQKICIVSTGIDLSTGDFDASKIQGKNNNNRFWEPVQEWNKDVLGYGTHLAGIVAGQDNGVGTLGVSPAFDLFIVRGLNDQGVAFEADVQVAIEQCVEAGSKLILLGTGSSKQPPAGAQQFYDQLQQQGILIVAGSGNKGETSVNYPARFNSVLGVGGVMEDGSHWEGSARGGQVKLAAPAYQIVSTALSSAAEEVEAVDGTGSAAAYVTAAAGLLWSHFDQCTAEQISMALQKTSTRWDAYTTTLGFGVPQVKVAYDVLMANGCDLTNYDHSTYQAQVPDDTTPETPDDEVVVDPPQEDPVDDPVDGEPKDEPQEEPAEGDDTMIIDTSSSSDDEALTPGAIGGIVAASLALLVLLAVVYIYYYKAPKASAGALAETKPVAAEEDGEHDDAASGTDIESNAHSIAA